MTEDRTIRGSLLVHVAGTVESCSVAAILYGIAQHNLECDTVEDGQTVSVDQALADLARAIMLVAGTQDKPWRERALSTVARIILEDVDNPQNETVVQ